jgi:hypothetical protein
LEITYYFITKYNADLVSFLFDKNAHKAINSNTRNFKHTWQTYNKIGKIPHKFSDNPLKFYRRKFGFKIIDYIWLKLYKRELLNDIEFIPNITFEDTPHTLAILKKRPKTVLLREELVYYFYNSDSITQKAYRNLLEMLKCRHIGLLFIYEVYKDALKKEFNFVAKNCVLKYLKDQYEDIKNADKSQQAELLNFFTKELVDLDNKKFIGFKLRRLTNWLKFKKMIRRYKQNEKQENVF